MSPVLFDRQVLAAHYRRAAGLQATARDNDFLWKYCARALQERLLEIKRDFPVTLEAGPARYVLQPEIVRLKNIRTPLFASVLEQAAGADLVLDEEMLPVAAQSLDAFISVGQLHWVNDVPGSLVQVRHVLKPDGLFLGCCLGGSSLFELRHSLAQAELAVYGGASPRVAPFMELQDMAALLQRAGFALPVADHEKITVTYDTLPALVADLRAGGQTLAIARRNRIIPSRRFWALAEEIYRQEFGLPDGRLPVTVEIIHALGWAPDSTQPQPLQRGSARQSLATILSPPQEK